MNRPLTAVDLFAGAGGATMGLKRAGWSVLGAVENDSLAAASYRANHPEVLLRDEDIEDVDAANLRAELGLERGDLGMLKACPPCQGYSSLGKRVPDDPRNDLVTEVWRFFREFRPHLLLLENVPGLRADARLASLLRRIRALGWGARSYVVDAVDFGVPQRRRRLIVLAAKGKRAAELPSTLQSAVPEDFDLTPRPSRSALSLAGCLWNDDPLHKDRPRSARVKERIQAVPEGGTRFDLPDELKLACHDDIARSATGSYGRIKLDGPAPTMTTRCTTPSCGSFIHPAENRSITLREAALLQTFPTDYTFVGGPGSIERQIGNAVPVKLVEALGLAVAGLL